MRRYSEVARDLIVVLVSTFAFGELVGFITSGASALLSVYFFEPIGVFAVDRAADLMKIELYAVMCALSVLGVARLRWAIVLLYGAISKDEKRSATLVEEMAYRMSNNFAVAKSILEEAIEQVVIMGPLHRNLHSARGAIALDSQSFLSESASDLKSTIGKHRPVSVTSTAAKCALPVAQAITLGLIVNEPVTNAPVSCRKARKNLR
jgi:two-component sensor histidine kinase